MAYTQRPSPNFRARKKNEVWELVVLHGTWMHSDTDALNTLTNPAKEVSCHYYITRQGEVLQLVSENNVAWHAGVSAWHGRTMLNTCALGIELGNAGPFNTTTATKQNQNSATDAMWAQAEPYTEAQYTALINLLRDIQTRYPHIGPEHILGHSEVAPDRKSDPGRHFDWARLAVAGVAKPRPLS
jgi:N-acetylmuramoyl-L-alanine amidase